jgi:hypothetical protein
MNSIQAFDRKAGGRAFCVAALPTLVVFLFYWLTCFRTFTWWDSSAYSAAALTLGVPHPPGSLLTVIAGWLIVKLPLGLDKFFALNLLSALITAVAVYIVGRIALNIHERFAKKESSEDTAPNYGPIIGVSLAILFFGLSITMWYYAIRFTPYATTALFTALIIMAMLAWQKHAGHGNSHIYLALITLLFGLDFSVHRTNLLILPGLLVWFLLFNPRILLSFKHWLFGAVGLIAGLSLHLLLIPIAAANPIMNANDPSSLSRLWDYVSLKQYGGDWLINIFPRKAPFIGVQVADYLRIFGNNFIVGAWPVVRYLPLAVGLTGLIILFKRKWRVAIGLVAIFLCASLGAIIYFNLPQNFFRSIDRHYMPSFVIFAIFIAYGTAEMMRAVLEPKGRKWVVVVVAVVLLVLMPLQAAMRNYGIVDGSKSYFAYDTAKNYLANLPERSILFTQADIDTYTLFCLQVAENFRPDITICNLSLMNTPWFIEQVTTRDKDFPFRLDRQELSTLSIKPWRDTTITVPVSASATDFGLPVETVMPDTITFLIQPTLSGQYIYVHDQMILKTVLANNWRRPICFSALLPESSIGWLMPYLRLEGLHWRLTPARSAGVEKDLLRRNLTANYSYRGFEDRSGPKEDPSKWLGWNYCSTFMRLAFMEFTDGDTAGCKSTIETMESLIATDNLSMPPDLAEAIRNACK